MSKDVTNVFIIGSKGIPGNYGGYETFVDKLTEYHKDLKNIKYHVACKSDNFSEFEYNNARCFNVKVPNIGPAQAIYYDVAALKKIIEYVKNNKISKFIVYILACRIGPFMNHYVKKIHSLGGIVYVNPDGHEWMRAKWSLPVRKYWKYSEKLMVKNADLLVCDSVNIEKYIKETYKKYNPNTTFIAYGAETRKSILSDNDSKLVDWYKEKGLKKNEYYLVVGRFVPENNYETMIKEFMKSKSKKDFAIITNVNDKFLNELENKLHYSKDSRIKFVGTVYDKELIMKIRENAFAYFHGHEVGGTNPSLLEALSSTKLNLLLDVGFNREVAEDGALYWNKENGNLAKLINKAEKMNKKDIEILSTKAKQRIKDAYSWKYISDEYEKLFTSKIDDKDLISIIVPVYNVEKYLSECLDSLLNQTYQNIEIVLIDDGSTDNSGIICDEYKKKDKRIRVFHKKNGGLSDARNYGLSNINGEYLTFVDSDDIISSNYIETLFICCKKTDSDIVVCRFKRFKDKEELKNVLQSDNYLCVNSSDYYLKTLYQNDHTIYSVSSCAKLYKKKIFKVIRFKKGKLNEDFCIINDILNGAKKVSLVDSEMYYYRISENSITNSSFNKDKLFVLEYCNQLLNNTNDEPVKTALMVTLYTRSIDLLTNMKESNYKDKTIEKELWNNIKKYRKLVITNKMVRRKIKISTFISYFGKNALTYCNVLFRKFKKINNMQ